MRRRYQAGLTVLEILLSVAIGGILLASLSGAVGQALQAQNETRGRTDLLQDGGFAMTRMLAAVSGTRRLVIPFADNPGTTWREHVREQTVPASPPEAGSVLATAVLAVTLPPSQDLDADGWADANNDRDYQDQNGNGLRDTGEPQRIDEDGFEDANLDGEAGIAGIDDNGDGLVDDTSDKDDDEDGSEAEDPLDGVDNDGDGQIDEDWDKDGNDDGEPGLAGVDDDNDGAIDEGNNEDDDEDGAENEDWEDTLAFFLQGDDLIERRAVPYDINGDSNYDGLDVSEAVIAQNVTRFRVERVPAPAGGAVTVDITLVLTGASGESVAVHSIARVGAQP